MTQTNSSATKTRLSHYGEILQAEQTASYLITETGEILFANSEADSFCRSDLIATAFQSPGAGHALLQQCLESARPQLGLLDLPGHTMEKPVRVRLSPLPSQSAQKLVLIQFFGVALETPRVQKNTKKTQIQDDANLLRRALHARQRSDKRFRLFLDSAIDGIGAVSSDGRINVSNAALARMLGEEILMGQLLFDYVDIGPALKEVDAPRDTATVLEALVNHPQEVYVSSISRDRYPAEMTVTPIIESSEVQYVIVMRDLTQRREHHEALARSQYLEAARDIARASELSKTRFLATVSHEMRTPMGAIATAADLLLNDYVLPDAQKQLVEVIRGSADRALDQINETLEHVRMDLRPIKDHPVSNFNPGSVLQSLAAQSRLAAEAKGLSLELSLGCDSDLSVSGYHHLFHRVVQNLLSNAVKYTNSGSISVSANCNQTGFHKGQNMITMEMRFADSGAGIDDDHVDRLFTPFETAANDFSSLADGAGLGLSIVKRAVEAMEGDIKVDSSLGVGTVFTVKLRFAMATQETLPVLSRRVDPIPATLRSMRFLVVDDNPLNRNLMGKLLESEGHFNRVVDGGERALEILQHMDFDAVLMDIGMPGIDGLETTRRLRSLPGCANLPVFGLTGFSDPEVSDRAKRAGMQHVYVKPLRREQLQEVSMRILAVNETEPTPEAPNLSAVPPKLIQRDVSRQIARIAGENWPNFVNQLHKECTAILFQLRQAQIDRDIDNFILLTNRAGTTVASVGAQALTHSFLTLEEMARSGKLDQTPETLAQTATLLEETRLILEQL